MNFFITILEQGLIYGILALGVYITYKILDFPDLTVDGSFPLGAAVTAALITRGMDPYLTLPIAFLAGVLAGICTGLIHVKGKVRDLLSGIIMMTALWSINLYIAGTSNVPLFSQETIFKNDRIEGLIPKALSPYTTLILIFLLTIVCKVILDLYLKTKSGFLLRAVGDNAVLVTSLAKDQGNVKILGLAISLFRKVTLLKATSAVLIGSVIYKACVAIALRSFEPQAMKLITAVLFLIILLISMERKKKVKADA